MSQGEPHDTWVIKVYGKTYNLGLISLNNICLDKFKAFSGYEYAELNQHQKCSLLTGSGVYLGHNFRLGYLLATVMYLDSHEMVLTLTN